MLAAIAFVYLPIGGTRFGSVTRRVDQLSGEQKRPHISDVDAKDEQIEKHRSPAARTEQSIRLGVSMWLLLEKASVKARANTYQ